MPDRTTEHLKSVETKDIKLDSQGRIVIARPDLAAKIREDLEPDVLSENLAGNGLCTGNTSCLSDRLVGLFDRLAGGGSLGR